MLTSVPAYEYVQKSFKDVFSKRLTFSSFDALEKLLDGGNLSLNENFGTNKRELIFMIWNSMINSLGRYLIPTSSSGNNYEILA